MTESQKEDLFIEPDLYEPHNQLAIIDEYRSANKGDYCKKSFFDFLKDKLQVEGYWKKIGLT